MRPLETRRLQLREFTREDAQFVLELHQHPDLVRFIPSVALIDLDGALAAIDRFRTFHRPDRGWWCVTRRDGTQVGAVVLKDIPPSKDIDLKDVEVGWRQHPAHSGNGYMTEAARALIDLGFDSGLPRLVAVVDPENLPSQRVCQRLGMVHRGRTRAYYDAELELFVLDRPLA